MRVVIYKLFRGTDIGFYPTRLVTSDDVKELDSLKLCPCIFQEYVPGEFDIRITVVNKSVYAARIEYDKDHQIIDTRVTSTACKPFELPDRIVQHVLQLMSGFGLIYGAIDMRYSIDRGASCK